VARGNLDPGCGAAQFHQQRHGRRGASVGCEPDGRAGGGNCFRGDAREAFGTKARVEADYNSVRCIFSAHHVPRNRVNHLPQVLVGKIFGDNAAPAIGAKFNLCHGPSV
jgi:hypothetical protein